MSGYRFPAAAKSIPSIGETLSDLRAKRVSSIEIVSCSLALADACRKDVAAFSEIGDDDALAAAAQADDRYAGGTDRELEGVPIAVKDLFDTSGLATRYGSAAYRDHVPAIDAQAVQMLRDKGAIVIGKTTTHEFAWGVTTSSTQFGNTLNPRDTSRIPGGSSGGMAAAIAYGAVSAGLGTDTGGSVRIPAALCGVVGYKPSFGRISTQGVFPLASSLDHIGVLGRSVDDIRRISNALGIGSGLGARSEDLRIGLILQLGPVPVSARVRRAFDSACDVLKRYHRLEHVADTGVFDGAFETFAGIVLAEGAAVHFSRHDREFIDASYEPETAQRLRFAESVTLGAYAGWQEHKRSLIGRVSGLFQSFDVLILPTCPCVAPELGVEHLAIGGWSGTVRQALMANTAPFNLTGLPAISIPLPVDDERDLPVGMQIVAPPGRDEELLMLANEFEKYFKAAHCLPSNNTIVGSSI